MALRLKSKWHRSKRSERNRAGSKKPKTLIDLASVIGHNIWKLAKESFVHMEKEGFRFPDDQQTIDFITEFIIYQIHIVDRMLYEKVTDEERAEFINALASHVIKTLEINQIELLGPGENAARFIDTMNDRFQNYAECEFGDSGPSYEFTRYLAQKAAEHMQISDDKWVIEQVIDIEAPPIAENIMRIAEDVLGLKAR